jgi:hypothetical protein
MILGIFGLVFGIVIGAGGILVGAGYSQGIADMLLRQTLGANPDGWALVQRGNRYTLDMLSRDDDADAWQIGDEDSQEWLEDPADQMHMLLGVPFALKLGSKRPATDVQTATAMSQAAGMQTDGGGDIDPSAMYSMQEITSKMTVGEMRTSEGALVKFLNPYVDLASERVVDLRNITKAFRYDAGSDTPRKAAKNATEAERSFDNLTDLKEFGKILSAFIAGAVAAFIGSSAGGGGGGVPNVGLVIDVAGGLGLL